MDWTRVNWAELGDLLEMARRQLRLHSWDALAGHMGLSLSTMKNLRAAIDSRGGSFRASTMDALEQLAVDAGLEDDFYKATGLPARPTGGLTALSGRPTSAGQGMTVAEDADVLQRILSELQQIKERLDEDER